MISELASIMKNPLIVIPARFNSSRLQGKPLIDLAGKPMIVRTAEKCLEVASPEEVVVATDDAKIIQACEIYGIRAEMTSVEHPTGSDRVAEIAARINAGCYINVQGDEPVFNSQDILKIARESLTDRNKTYIGYCDLRKEEWGDTKHIKLIFGLDNQLIYIGRANVPGSHEGDFKFGYRQVCVYAYTADTLERFTSSNGRTPLEKVEDNEVMRFLELGMAVEVVKLSGDSISVDREQDIQRVLKMLGGQND